MYESFYGLSELPFELTANPKFLFLNESQREALSILQYGLFSAKSLTLLIGEAGTGKTTLIQAALQSDRCRDVRGVYLNNPTLGPHDFIRLLARKVDLGEDAGESKPILLERLEALLRERRAAGQTIALIVDEAQSISVETLEEIRLLANIETPSAKLLPLVLAGQPELAVRLEQPNLRQLKQRVTLRSHLQPFSMADTAAYIARRITTAGGTPSRMFTLDAVKLIHEYAGGIPRTISVICDNALVSGMALGRSPVNRAIVVEVGRELCVNGSGATASTEAPPARPDAAPISPRPMVSRHDAKTPSSPPDDPVPRSMAALSQRVGRTVTE
jgi:type II secretory pathway predicted ATPase ExeA